MADDKDVENGRTRPTFFVIDGADVSRAAEAEGVEDEDETAKAARDEAEALHNASQKRRAAEVYAQRVAEEAVRRADVAAALAARSPEAVAAAEEFTLETYPNPRDFRPSDRPAFATSCASDAERDRWVADHGSDLWPSPEQATVIEARVAEIAAALIARWLVLDDEAREIKHEAWDARAAADREKALAGDGEEDDEVDPGMGQRPSASASRPKPAASGPAARKRRRSPSKARSDLRVASAFRKVPAAITDSQKLSGAAVRAANVIARSTNVARWNLDLRCDLPYSKLADRMGKSMSTAQRAIRELVRGGYFPEVPRDLNRGGIRYHLYGPCTNPKCQEGLRSKGP